MWSKIKTWALVALDVLASILGGIAWRMSAKNRRLIQQWNAERARTEAEIRSVRRGLESVGLAMQRARSQRRRARERFVQNRLQEGAYLEDILRVTLLCFLDQKHLIHRCATPN